MFNDVLINRYCKLVGLDKERAEKSLKRQAKYLKVNPHFLLKSYIVLADEKQEQEREKALNRKYMSKNLLIMKYKDEIVRLYEKDGFGYLKISRAMYINHKANISKSSIENFVKMNNLIKGEK